MEPNTKLAIVVPTYNRASFLDFFFEVHVPRCRKYGIPIHISDCASQDNTAEIVKKWQQQYPLIHYSCTTETVHPDENAENAVNLSRAEYTWITGDSYEIPMKSFDFIMDIINQDDDIYDVITLNLVGRIKDIPQKIYHDCNDVLANLAWMQACLSCNIYSRKLIENGDQAKYRGTCFCQVGFVLDYLGQHDFKLLWAQTATVETLKHPIERKKGWGKETFPHLFEKWPQLITDLSGKYTEESRNTAKKSLAIQSQLLGWRNVLYLRAQGLLNRQTFSEYSPKFQEFTPKYFTQYARFLTLIPQNICKIMIVSIEWFRRKNYRIRKFLNLYSR